MNDFMLMEPSNQSFQEMFSNGVKYIVPRYQRDYAWDLEQLEDLWADINTLEEEHYHYMGYIVLKRTDEQIFEVIDGQQRLVTISLIIIAGMKKIKEQIDLEIDIEANKKRLDLFFDRLIGALNPVSLKVNNKLFLNRNNQKHFKDICSKMEALNLRVLSKTNKRLNSAFTFFSNSNMGNDGAEIAQFIEMFTKRLIFTKIVVQDNLNAYKVFETLNARGVQLSTPDLLKNNIFSVITKNDDVLDEQLDELDEDWAGIITQLGDKNFTDFVRYHYLMQHSLTTKKNLFKSIREKYVNPKDAYTYLSSLVEYASIYSALLNPFDEWWTKQDGDYSKAKHYLEGLKLFGIRQPMQILMVAFTKFDSKEFILTLKYLYTLSVRYNIICHNSPNEQEKKYNKIAINIFNETHKRASHVKNCPEFKELYPDDNEFKTSFEYHKMASRSSAKKIRFLLTDIENSFGRELNYLDTTLEHICPYNPDQNWQEDFGEGINDIPDRLGNLILLERDELKRASFIEKKKVYIETSFRLAKKVAEYESWDLTTLNAYQSWLADQAIKTWKVNYE